MRRSELIVNRLLEAYEGETAPQGSVLAVIRNQPSFHATMGAFEDFLRQQGFDSLESFLEAGGASFIKDASGGVTLLSQRASLAATKPVLQAVIGTFGLRSDSPIGFRRGPGQPKVERSLQEIFARTGQYQAAAERQQQEQKKQAEAARKAAQVQKQRKPEPPAAQAGLPQRKRGYKPWGAEDEERFLGDVVGGHEPAPHRFVLGFNYPKNAEGGVLVREVEPGSAAAKSGLQPNDVILGVGEHINVYGTTNPRYRIKNARQLHHVLDRLAPNTVLPLMVRRGSGMVEIPLVPEVLPD